MEDLYSYNGTMAPNATFEQKMQRLEQIVRAMERGDVGISEAFSGGDNPSLRMQ